MNLIATLAQRNTFRNYRRTFLTVLLIACGLAALIFTDSFVKGMVKTMSNISTQTYLGHAQIHKIGYRASNDVDEYLTDFHRIVELLSLQESVVHFSARTMSGAMLSSSANISSVLLIGVNGESEANVGELDNAMVEGSYLTGNNSELLIGYDLADLLEVSLGDRIVVTVSAAHGGDLSQELFRVSGLFKFNDRTMDNNMAFINLDKSKKLLNIKGVHEVALTLRDLSSADDSSLPLWRALKSETREILNWRELVPQLNSVLEVSDFSTLIVSIIMFSLVALGLINSMFMSIFERHQEFGVLLALGTRPTQIFNQIMTEGMLIGLISAAMGFVLGLGLSVWISVVGIDYGHLEMSGLTINEPIYPVIDISAFVLLSVSIFTITTLSCIYPAIHAARLSPSNAMRKVA